MRSGRDLVRAVAVLTAAATLAACTGGERPTPGSVVGTDAVTTTAAGPTTTLPAPAPIVPADLWPIAAASGLLAPAPDGTTPFPSLVVGVPGSGPAGLDLASLVGRTRLLQQVAFEARLVSGLLRRAVLGLHGTDGDATAWVATRPVRIDPAEAPTPTASAVPGAVAWVRRPAGAATSTVEVDVARGPVSITVEVRQRSAEPTVEPAALAEADAVVTALIAAVDARIAACTTPCTGLGGAVPASAVRALAPGECANRTAPGPDFVPPPDDSAPAACTQPHAFHAAATVPVPEDPRVYETVTTATPPDHPAVALAAACRTATVRWMTAAAYAPGPGGTFALRVQLPTPAEYQAGARVATCVISPADTSSPAAALNPLPG